MVRDNSQCKGRPGESPEGRWRGLLAAWSRSGLTQAAFCREHALSEQSLSWWKGELRRRDGARSGQEALRGEAARSAGPAFAAVRVVSSQGGEAGLAMRDDGRAGTRTGAASDGDGEFPASLEVVLGNGRRIRVGSAVDAAVLAMVVSVLEGLGC